MGLSVHADSVACFTGAWVMFWLLCLARRRQPAVSELSFQPGDGILVFLLHSIVLARAASALCLDTDNLSLHSFTFSNFPQS